MKCDPDDYAYPNNPEHNHSLTKREEFAKAIMAGFAAAPSTYDTENDCRKLAEHAVNWADALIVALNREQS